MSSSPNHSDPESEVPFAKALYGDDKFMRAFFNSLSDDGILVMQLGEAPSYDAPDETVSKFLNRAATTTLLATLGFESIHAYEEVSPWHNSLLPKCNVSDLKSLSSVYSVSLRVLRTMDICHWLQVI